MLGYGPRKCVEALAYCLVACRHPPQSSLLFLSAFDHLRIMSQAG